MLELVRNCPPEFKEYYIQMQAAKRSQAPLPSQVYRDYWPWILLSYKYKLKQFDEGLFLLSLSLVLYTHIHASVYVCACVYLYKIVYVHNYMNIFLFLGINLCECVFLYGNKNLYFQTWSWDSLWRMFKSFCLVYTFSPLGYLMISWSAHRY